MQLQISVSQCLSPFKTLSRYLNTFIYMILLSLISHRHSGMLLSLSADFSLFFQLMIKPFFLLFFNTIRRSPCGLLSLSIDSVPLTYFILVSLWLLIIHLFMVSNFVRISARYRLNK